MGLFKKNKKEVMKNPYAKQGVPSLPELPRLPELPSIEYEDSSNNLERFQLPQLPSFPNNSLGDKFSQNTIKEAVTGKKEGEGAVADEFELPELEEPQMTQRPFTTPRTKTLEDYEDEDDETPIPSTTMRSYEPRRIPDNYNKLTKKAEPIFIRLDKFEESLEIFEKAKEQVSDIEETLRHIKHLKEKEEDELSLWEKEIQNIKNEIEKVDRDVFSKVE